MRKFVALTINGAILAMLAGCGLFIGGSECKDDEADEASAGFDLYDEAPRALPPPVPTLSTFPSCSALQEELRGMWQSRVDTEYDSDDYYRGGGTNMPTRKHNPSKPKSGCSKFASGKQSSKKAPATAESSTGGAMPDAATSAPMEGGPGNAKDGGTDGGDEDTFTNTQEKGVDEPDVVKVGVHHIFVERFGELVVVDRKTYAQIGTLPIPGLENPTLFVDGETLVVLGGKQGGKSGYETTVQIFNAPAGALPTLAKTHVFDGQAYDSRYVGSKLVLVFRDRLPWNNYDDTAGALPVHIEMDSVAGIPCQNIIRPAVADYDARFVKVVSLDAKALDAVPQYAAVVGGGDQIYMTDATLYLTKKGQDWLVVTRVDFDAATGALKPAAVGLVEGRVKDQWAFKEYQHEKERLLSIATTTGELWSRGENKAQNHIFVLRQEETKLQVAGAFKDFGTGEDIRSVRYVGTMAYVVTFKKTDPLFAFDMANPLAPKYLGELKIPGFSTYMHPVAPGRLLGVGFDALEMGDFALYQGIQISLFDVANPMDMKRLDVKIHGDRGSSSEVTGDHHAFFYDATRKIAGIPIVELKDSEHAFSGAVLYDVQDAALVEKARITHIDMIPKECRDDLNNARWWQGRARSPDVNRLFLVDGKLLTISRYGLKAHDPDQPKTETAHPFSMRTPGPMLAKTACGL